jgi:hypothetical protein
MLVVSYDAHISRISVIGKRVGKEPGGGNKEIAVQFLSSEEGKLQNSGSCMGEFHSL